MLNNIFSVGISTFKLSIDNQPLIEYAQQTTKINKKKEFKDILTNPIFNELNEIVLTKMNDYFKSIWNNNYNMKLNEAWTNVGPDIAITIPHVHTESFLSAVYYPRAEDGELIFLNPNVSTISHQLTQMIGSHNPYTAEYHAVPSRSGILVIFNSMLQHMVRCSNNDRISVAYNATPEVKDEKKI